MAKPYPFRSFFDPKLNRYAFWFWYGLFVLNDRVFKIKALETTFWQFVKVELFYVKGTCRSSGYCCQNLEITQGTAPIRQLEAFKALVEKKPKYNRFQPILNEDGSIQKFNCSCLTTSNRCSDYENRPDMCRRFPFNTFFQYDYVRSGCGYKIAVKQPWPQLKNSRCSSLVKKVLYLNNLIY